ILSSQDLFHGSIEMELTAPSPADAHNGLHHFPKTSLGVPGTQLEPGIVHQTVKRRGFAGHGSQEKDREFHEGQKPGIAEVLAHMSAEATEYLQAQHPFQ